MTAKTKVAHDTIKLGDSINNPFGTPGDEECLFSLEEHPHDDSTNIDPKTQTLNIRSGAISIVDDRHDFKDPVENKEATISPIFGHAKRFNRPQSAKPVDLISNPQSKAHSMNRNRFSKTKFSAHHHATLELKRIFTGSKGHPYEESLKSFSKMSKPPMGRSKNFRKLKKPRLLNEDMSSFTGMYNSEVDPRTTMTSFNSKNMFATTKGRGISKEKPSLRAYKSIDAQCRKGKAKGKRKLKRPIRPMTAKFKMPKLKNFLQNADTLREMKEHIMNDQNYTK